MEGLQPGGYRALTVDLRDADGRKRVIRASAEERGGDTLSTLALLL